MRGKVLLAFPIRIIQRITPAYAGKSFVTVAFLPCWIGSPPPMRGKVVMSGGYIVQTRITPAYAGKRYEEILNDVEDEDHPRLCGEKLRRFKSV